MKVCLAISYDGFEADKIIEVPHEDALNLLKAGKARVPTVEDLTREKVTETSGDSPKTTETTPPEPGGVSRQKGTKS